MSLLALGLCVTFLVGWHIPFLRRFFAVAIPPDPLVLVTILIFTLAWAATLLLIWKQRWYERFLLGRNVVAPAAPQPARPKVIPGIPKRHRPDHRRS
jgi:hypothetical protein